MCRVLEVSRSGYYKWLNSGASATKQRRMELLGRIENIYARSKERYGHRRVHQQLKREGMNCNHKTVEKLMREHEMKPRRKRKYKSTTDSKHTLPVAKNVVKRNFTPDRPNQIWVSDITYIDTLDGWLYLTVFIDLYSRMVVGWSMSDSLVADAVVSAYEMAVRRRGVNPEIVHSDRGIQYASELFRNQLPKTCRQSMSRKANCWDNAVAESFFGSIKSELIYHETFRTRKAAELSIFEYIEIFYNRQRLHSTLGYITPEEFDLKGKKAA
jgi:transposase InsO family protein